ncbi:MAG TPA: transporter, partial [Steroidobacteraceae bacterium]
MKGVELALVLTGVLLNAAAQLLLKAGARTLTGLSFTAGNALLIAERAILSVPILCGLLLYAISVVVWVLALSRVQVSVAYPMLSIGYVV